MEKFALLIYDAGQRSFGLGFEEYEDEEAAYLEANEHCDLFEHIWVLNKIEFRDLRKRLIETRWR